MRIREMQIREMLGASIAFTALFASVPVLAQDDATAPAASTITVELPSGPEGPALWKIEDEDTTIYLFGTIHALDPSVQWYDAEIDAALQSADTVVTETPMDPESEAASAALGMQLGTFSDGTTLRSLLTPEQVEVYEAAIAGLGLPPVALTQLDRTEPWAMAFSFVYLPLLQQGYDLNAGVDKVILSRAPDTPRDALETTEYTLGLLDNLSTEAQVDFMMGAIEAIPDIRAELDAMVVEWLAGDTEALNEIMNDDAQHPEVTEAILYLRNANWADWIEGRMEQPGTVFIAVGAAHLAGDRSVQDLLAERGIETARVQ